MAPYKTNQRLRQAAKRWSHFGTLGFSAPSPPAPSLKPQARRTSPCPVMLSPPSTSTSQGMSLLARLTAKPSSKPTSRAILNRGRMPIRVSSLAPNARAQPQAEASLNQHGTLYLTTLSWPSFMSRLRRTKADTGSTPRRAGLRRRRGNSFAKSTYASASLFACVLVPCSLTEAT